MWFTHDSDEAQAYAKVTQEGEHHAKLSHEVIAAAASYEAAKAYEHHARKQHEPVSHETALALLAAVTGGFVDRFAETKGLDELEKHRAKELAQQQAKNALAQSGQL